MFFKLSETVENVKSINDGWVSEKPGIKYSLVHIDKSQGLWVTKVRFDAGVVIPAHLHTGQVIGFTTAGKWGYPKDNIFFTEGDYCYEPAGTFHEVEIPKDNKVITEAIFLLWGALITFEDNSSTIIKEYSDATTIENEYITLCKEHNVQPTDYIVK